MAVGCYFLIASSVIPQAAVASGFHSYAVGYESSHGTAYTGISDSRLDQGPSNRTYVMYQSTWVLFSGGWFEVGTGHSTNLDYWYWGWWPPGGSWTQLGWRAISNGSSHTFQIYRSSSYTWNFSIDSTVRVPLTSSTVITGNKLEAGLESYDSVATMPMYYTNSLNMALNQNPWTLWDGRDGMQLDGAPMCGGWYSNAIWKAGEHATC